MTVTDRRRLLGLYKLRAQVDYEIAQLEAQRIGIRPKAPVAKCGTDGGYYRHRRTLKEAPCDACRAAHSKATREREQRKKVA